MIKEKKFVQILFIGFLITFISCNAIQNSLKHEQIVTDYFKGLNTGDFSLISKCVSDSIQTTEKEYLLTRNQKELYQQFQWDSVFNPKYDLTDLESDSNSIMATVSKICKRIDFLQDTAMVFKVTIDIKDSQITKIQITDYVYLNFATWQSRRDTLVAWIDKNHPEIYGFLDDMTLKGAQNYLKAIELYRNEK